jgi:oligopeptide/dipeptide ABC transporter ATP-binding protein
MSTPEILSVSDLERHYGGRRLNPFRPTPMVRAVRGVSFAVERGRTFGLVGESGSGKSTVARLAVGLEPPSAGTVSLDGEPVHAAEPEAWWRMRRKVQMVFQDTTGSLDPRATVGSQLREALDIHDVLAPSERKARALAVLSQVGLQPHFADRYPHELSGGQVQRVVIARALMLDPDLLVCDEPTSALDVSVQAQIINLLLQLQEDLGLSMLFISHNLALVRHVAHRVGVMYLGRLVEIADTETLFANPRHPYTQALVSAVPVDHPRLRRARRPLEGSPPSPLALPRGCAFQDRCPRRLPVCAEQDPGFTWHGEATGLACNNPIPAKDEAA